MSGIKIHCWFKHFSKMRIKYKLKGTIISHLSLIDKFVLESQLNLDPSLA